MAALLIGAVLGIINMVMILPPSCPPLVATLSTWMAYKGDCKGNYVNADAISTRTFRALAALV